MALNIDLISDAGLVLELDASPYGIHLGGGLGATDLGVQYSAPWQRGYRPMVNQNIGNRTTECSVKITGTTQDDWANNYRQMAHVLALANEYTITAGRRGACAHLCIQLTGATATTVYEVVRADVPPITLFRPSLTLAAPYALDVPLKLELKPWGHQQALTRTSASIKAWGGTTSNDDPNTQVLTVTPASGMTRESPALLRVSVGNATHGAIGTYGVQQMKIGRRSRGNVQNFKAFLQAEPGTASGYDVTTGSHANIAGVSGVNASAQGGQYLELQKVNAGAVDGVVANWTLYNLPDMAGRYEVFGIPVNWTASAVGVSSVVGAFTLGYGGASGDAVLNTSATAADNRWHTPFSLGYMTITDPGTPGAVHRMRLYARSNGSGATGGKIGIDAIALLPVDEEVFTVSASGAVVTSSGSIVLDGLDANLKTMVLDASGQQSTLSAVYSALPPYGMQVPPTPSKFVVLPTQWTSYGYGAGAVCTTYTITIDYQPHTDLLL